MNQILTGAVFWGILLFAAWALRPKSGIYGVTLEKTTPFRVALTVLTLVVLIGGSSFLMTLCPMWNGTVEQTGDYNGDGSKSRIIKNKDQYELMADALLDGRLYIDYDDVDSKLLEMENPYDPDARKEQKVSYHWDHAFYNGRYYMYFGVVPVFLLFIPYKLITGMSLTTFHATQIFVGAAILGLFLFFRLMARKFFPKLPYAVYLLLASSVSIASMVHCIAKPAMYMTAFAAGICMEIWSVYFYVKAVWATESENRAIFRAFIGALLGAMAFGCRPPIAIGNLMVIPCLIHFLRSRKITGKLILKLAAAATPYIIIGALLMLYNYARFDSPFEFGQSYQLTVADQSQYGDVMMTLNFNKVVNGLIYFFFQSKVLTDAFPFVVEGGIFFTFPVFVTGMYALTVKKVREGLRSNKLTLFITGGMITCVVILVMDIVWSPYLLSRYREDMMWLLGMLVFVAVGMMYAEEKPAVTVAAEPVVEEPAAVENMAEAVEPVVEEPAVTEAAPEIAVPAEVPAAAASDDARGFSTAVTVLSIFAVLIAIILFVRLNLDYFTEEQLQWIMDTAVNLRFGVPFPVIEA